MTRRVVRRPIVLDDLIEQYVYLADESIDVAERFLDAAEATFKTLADNPAIGNAYSGELARLANIRRWFVEGFPNHLIFYTFDSEAVEIIRVLHGARDVPEQLT